jgi:hypothetical protein
MRIENDDSSAKNNLSISQAFTALARRRGWRVFATTRALRQRRREVGLIANRLCPCPTIKQPVAGILDAKMSSRPIICSYLSRA